MANSPKKKPRVRAAKTSSTVGVTSKSTPAKPFLRFYHSEELHRKTILVLTNLESARDPTSHRAALADIAIELTCSGLHYYFVEPLKVAKAGFILEQSASLGMASVQQVMGTVIRNVIARMTGAQLLSISQSLRQFMR